jgi:glucose/arabinose dehydrogenase
MKKLYISLIAMMLMKLSIVSAQQISITTFSGSFSLPIAIENCGDSRLFIVQQRGIIYIVDSLGVRVTTPFINLSSIVSQSGGERGLLGLAFHPNYKQNGYFYVNYTTTASPGATRISRFSVSANDSNVANPSSELILMSINQDFANHNGGTLRFGPDGYLYIGMGDGGSGNDPNNRAQNPQSYLGKFLRIDVDNPQPPLNYGIPADNPFVGNSAYLPEIWAIGMRNPWKFSFDFLLGDLWSGDVGQNALEEINREPLSLGGGHNYGWRCYEGNIATPVFLKPVVLLTA